MAKLPQTLKERWIYALKPKSWPKLLVPAFLGQAIGVAVTGSVNIGALVAGILFTVAHLVTVVLLNDWGDQDVDRTKRRLFPETGSPKTIPDQILAARSVLWAGLGSAAIAGGMAIAAQLWFDRPGLAGAGLGCVALFWVYTFPPIKLNYRGGGELLEMFGVGFALPWWNAYLQGGESMPEGLVILPGFALLCLSSALASGLSDEASDRIGGKRTFATMFGGESLTQAIDGLILGGTLAWAMLPLLVPGWAPHWMIMPPVLVLLINYRSLRFISQTRSVGSLNGFAAYKGQLHECIWRGSITFAASILLFAWLSGGLGLAWFQTTLRWV